MVQSVEKPAAGATPEERMEYGHYFSLSGRLSDAEMSYCIQINDSEEEDPTPQGY